MSTRYALVALCLSFIAASVQAARPSDAAFAASTPFFQAIEDEDIEVAVIPADSKRVTLQITNKTDRPLRIQMPRAMAAAPVLAQFQPFPFNNNNNNNNNFLNNNGNRGIGSPQVLGIGNQGNQGAQNNFPFFNVPAGKVVKKRLPAVCLEHGRPDPNPRVEYELKRLKDVTDNPEMESILAWLASEKISQRVAQLAAWHYCNSMDWETLANLKTTHLNGQSSPQFRASEVHYAKELVERLDKSLREQSEAERTRPSLSAR